MISSIQPTKASTLPASLHTEVAAHRRSLGLLAGRIVDIALVAVVIAATLYLLDVSDRVAPSPGHATSAIIQSPPKDQILPSDPRDPAVSADLVAVRNFRDVIARELESVNSRLQFGMRKQDDIRRRNAIERMLSNAGGTGLDDRVAQIEAAIRLRSSEGFNTNRDQSSITQAIRNLHDTAISCRSGALAAAAIGVKTITEEPLAAE